MVDRAIYDTIMNYLEAVRVAGINVQAAVLYGSQARGEGTEDSDIDLIVIAPEFDQWNEKTDDLIDRLWELRIYTDARIEPIACGMRQWEEDDGIPIIEIARREGIAIPFEREPA